MRQINVFFWQIEIFKEGIIYGKENKHNYTLLQC